MLPRLPIHLCTAERESLSRHAQAFALRTTTIQSTAADHEMLRHIDIASLGASREKHRRYRLDDPTMKGVFLDDGGERIGYAYVAATGHIGPLAVMHADAMPGAFSTALALAAAGHARQISVFIPGTSEALAIAVSQGMRLTLPMVLMATRDCGGWMCYLPRNPGFM